MTSFDRSYSKNMDNSPVPVVIDIGAGVTKAGFAGEGCPRSVFPSVVGRLRHVGLLRNSHLKDCYVGEEAHRKRGILQLKHPISNGIVSDWESLERIWDHVFTSQLQIDPMEHLIFLAESMQNSTENRRKMMEILFEKVGCPGVCFENEPTLALQSTGKNSGIIVDLGYGSFDAVPIFHGNIIPEGITHSSLEGVDISRFLLRELAEKNMIITGAERVTVNKVKEDVCYVAGDFEEELKSEKPEQFYELPGHEGQMITIGRERFLCPEILFQPHLYFDRNADGMLGIDEMIRDSIEKCEMELGKELISNVVLCGGTSLLPGIRERLEKEFKKIVPPELAEVVNVVTPEKREFCVWEGGSMLVSDKELFKKMCISKEKYDESGG